MLNKENTGNLTKTLNSSICNIIIILQTRHLATVKIGLELLTLLFVNAVILLIPRPNLPSVSSSTWWHNLFLLSLRAFRKFKTVYVRSAQHST